MTGTSPGLSSDTRTLGQVLHASRIRHNPPTERPRNVAPWEDRAPWQQQLDEEMAADLEAEVRRRVAAELRDRARKLWPPGMYRDQLDLAAAQVVLHGGQGQERSDEKEPEP